MAPNSRKFYVVSITKAIDSDATMTEEFNQRFNRTVPAGVPVHMIGMCECAGRVVCLFREYDEKRGAK